MDHSTSPQAPTKDAVLLQPPQVWVVQPRVRRYRLPLWQRVYQRAGQDYRLKVLGPLEEVVPLQAEQNDYLHETPCRWSRVAGRRLGVWPDLGQAIRQQRPQVVVFCATPSILSSWTLPGVVRRYGGVSMAWTKVHSQSGRRHWWTDFIRWRYYRRFERAICYGQQSRAELISLGYPAVRVTVAQNTIDTDRCFDQPEALAARAAELRRRYELGSSRLIVSIGRMIARKRHLDLVRAWPKLRKLDRELRLVLIGSGPLLDEVRHAAEQTDRERILVTGEAPEGDDYAWLSAADLVVLPGALGLAINQALALGRPTIVADEPGADAEILEHGLTGWRYPRGDLAALTRVVGTVLEDATERDRVRQHARQLMREELTLDHLVDQLDQAFREGLRLAGASGA